MKLKVLYQLTNLPGMGEKIVVYDFCYPYHSKKIDYIKLNDIIVFVERGRVLKNTENKRYFYWHKILTPNGKTGWISVWEDVKFKLCGE
jgi:hypothetical protein